MNSLSKLRIFEKQYCLQRKGKMDIQEFKKKLQEKNVEIKDKEIIYEKSLEKLKSTNSFIFMEELAELIQAISKKERKIEDADYMLIEEIADVEIILELLKKRWNIEEEMIEKAKEIKLERLINKQK